MISVCELGFKYFLLRKVFLSHPTKAMLESTTGDTIPSVLAGILSNYRYLTRSEIDMKSLC